MGMLIAGIVIGMIIGATTLMVIACCAVSSDLDRSMEKWSRDNER